VLQPRPRAPRAGGAGAASTRWRVTAGR